MTSPGGSRNGASSRKGCVVSGQTTKASNNSGIMDTRRGDTTAIDQNNHSHQSMADVKFNNRGWSTTSEDAQTPMTKANVVVNLSEHARIDPTGRIDRLLCGCYLSAAEKHQCNGNCKCAKLGKNCYPILCGCRGRCDPAVDAQSVPVGKGLQLVMANEVDPGGDSSDEPETSSDDDCEWRSSTSSEESRGSHGDTAEDILE